MTIKTLGLTHVSLEVADMEKSLTFYQAMFGVKEYYRDHDMIQVQGPGPDDIIVFTRSAQAGKIGGINHFGFRLTDPEEMQNAIATAEQAGAEIIRSGEYEPGLPYLYLKDPDGYTIEIWYE